MALKSETLSPSQLTALHALFHLYEPRFLEATEGGAGSDDARGVRLAWASGILQRDVSSFSSLRPDEAARLIELMKKALGQEVNSGRRPRRRRPDRNLAHAYGTAGRRRDVSNEIALVDAPTLELLDRLRQQIGWTPERLAAFLHSSKSPVRSGVIRTLAEANRVLWAMKNIARHRKPTAPDAAGLKRAG